mmetsp:Transcript_25825/g.83436  ORF Transcript_25825/g.83436 Transcript_25825/m.83436 type:complete len:397 (-) Transcript_25825:670-1860(-)
MSSATGRRRRQTEHPTRIAPAGCSSCCSRTVRSALPLSSINALHRFQSRRRWALSSSSATSPSGGAFSYSRQLLSSLSAVEPASAIRTYRVQPARPQPRPAPAQLLLHQLHSLRSRRNLAVRSRRSRLTPQGQIANARRRLRLSRRPMRAVLALSLGRRVPPDPGRPGRRCNGPTRLRPLAAPLIPSPGCAPHPRLMRAEVPWRCAVSHPGQPPRRRLATTPHSRVRGAVTPPGRPAVVRVREHLPVLRTLGQCHLHSTLAGLHMRSSHPPVRLGWGRPSKLRATHTVVHGGSSTWTPTCSERQIARLRHRLFDSIRKAARRSSRTPCHSSLGCTGRTWTGARRMRIWSLLRAGPCVAHRPSLFYLRPVQLHPSTQAARHLRFCSCSYRKLGATSD